MTIQVPATITEPIRALADSLSPGVDLIYVSASPVADAAVNDCFPTVDRQVAREGGSVLFGWQIWEWPTLFVEAEFHAVWRMPSNKLLDITPKPHRISNILFLSDPVRKYEGRQVNNVRRPICEHPAVKEFLENFDLEFEVLNRGERAHQHAVVLSGAERLQMEGMHRRRGQLQQQLAALTPKLGRNEPCYCGSGQKYKKCHGR